MLVLTLPHLEQFHSPHHPELKRDWRQVCKHNRINWTGTNNWEHHSWIVVRAQWFTLNYHLPVACEQALIIGVFAWASLPPPPPQVKYQALSIPSQQEVCKESSTDSEFHTLCKTSPWLMNKEGSFKRNCGARSEGEYNKVIWYYQQSY